MQLLKDAYGMHHHEYATSMNNVATLFQARPRGSAPKDTSHRDASHRDTIVTDSPAKDASWAHDAAVNTCARVAAHTCAAADRPTRARAAVRTCARLPTCVSAHPWRQALGRYGEAEPLLMEASRIQQKTLGHDHPHTVASLSNLATVYEAMGQKEMAASMQSLVKQHKKTWEEKQKAAKKR